MKTFAITDKGLYRELNQDNFFASSEPVGLLPNLFIVADGMGGANAGEVASLMAVDEFVKYAKDFKDENVNLEDIFIKGIEKVNNVIYELSASDQKLFGMGTTFVACTLLEEELIIANIGDSRLYVFGEELHQITVDHSYVEELIRSGEITRDESYSHPEKNIITRAMGVVNQVEVDIFKMKNENIQEILLCSDGLTNMINDKRILEIISDYKQLDSQGELLLKESLDNGGNDNITLIIIDLNS